MSAAFDEAEKLIKRDPLPRNILEKMADLESQIDRDEIEDFMWFYEKLHLKIDDKSNK